MITFKDVNLEYLLREVKETAKEQEDQVITIAMARTRGSGYAVAKVLGIPEKTVYRMIERRRQANV